MNDKIEIGIIVDGIISSVARIRENGRHLYYGIFEGISKTEADEIDRKLREVLAGQFISLTVKRCPRSMLDIIMEF